MAKKAVVQDMFNGIAPKYDLLNHLLSLGIDRCWRRCAMKRVREAGADYVLDVACGTGDFSLEALRHGVKRVVGVDISENMLAVAKKKIEERGLIGSVDFCYGDSENLPFPSEEFDAVTVAFGVRNFEHLEQGLKEMYRVLKSGGVVVILEFSKPARFPMKQLYRFYFKRVLPWIGGKISGDRRAYEYLPTSVFAFPEGSRFLDILAAAGFKDGYQRRLTFGIATLYVGKK